MIPPFRHHHHQYHRNIGTFRRIVVVVVVIIIALTYPHPLPYLKSLNDCRNHHHHRPWNPKCMIYPHWKYPWRKKRMIMRRENCCNRLHIRNMRVTYRKKSCIWSKRGWWWKRSNMSNWRNNNYCANNWRLRPPPWPIVGSRKNWPVGPRCNRWRPPWKRQSRWKRRTKNDGVDRRWKMRPRCNTKCYCNNGGNKRNMKNWNYYDNGRMKRNGSPPKRRRYYCKSKNKKKTKKH